MRVSGNFERVPWSEDYDNAVSPTVVVKGYIMTTFPGLFLYSFLFLSYRLCSGFGGQGAAGVPELPAHLRGRSFYR